MKVIAFNGSPRKKWNTAMLLKKIKSGAITDKVERKSILAFIGVDSSPSDAF